MWTLIVITIVTTQTVAGQPASLARGGVSTTTTFLDFPDQQKCEAAAAAVAVKLDAFPSTAGNTPTPGAYYRIIAKCVAR
jgi:hypothetical protein